MSSTKKEIETKYTDAGTRSYEHYKTRLPAWRFALRNFLIPVIRAETPSLASLQRKCQSQTLDSYFALAANLGTHTFFMIFLPILFWCGYSREARAMVHVLALGVYLSGYVKDLLCLPRPMSPPLQRISRSASAALEYGFPSTHSTNAVSVALYAAFDLYASGDSLNPSIFKTLLTLCGLYTLSITFGRIYCGMHGFFDVIVGIWLGAAIAVVQWVWGEAFDDWLIGGSSKNALLVILVVLVAIRTHPEPVDDCPCFDDSVAFAGTVIGVEVGGWHFARGTTARNDLYPAAVPFSLQEMGLPKASLRIVVGVLIVFLWRGVAKPTLLKVLPPLFRVIEQLGLASPRKFFLRATQYEKVPPLRKDDNVIPPASEIPSMITSLRHPRKRAISIGPQSEADAYEAMHFRERRRRHSRSSEHAPSPLALPVDKGQNDESIKPATILPKPALLSRASTSPDPKSLTLKPDSKAGFLKVTNVPDDALSDEALEEQDAKEDRELFRKLQTPRVRYDVEVVTKLIVYAGIGWFSVAGIPWILVGCGLGLST